MDQELLREYRTLHGLQRTAQDIERATDYLSRRLEQAGFSASRRGSAVWAVLDSGVPGPSLGFGARMELQEFPSGAAHALGHDAACAVALTAAARAAARLSRGRLSVLFRDGRQEPPFFLKEGVEICLAPAPLGSAVIQAAPEGAEAVRSACAAAVRAVLGREPEQGAEPCRSACGCRLGIGASPNPALGKADMDFRKGAMEHGADILLRLFSMLQTGEYHP